MSEEIKFLHVSFYNYVDEAPEGWVQDGICKIINPSEKFCNMYHIPSAAITTEAMPAHIKELPLVQLSSDFKGWKGRAGENIVFVYTEDFSFQYMDAAFCEKSLRPVTLGLRTMEEAFLEPTPWINALDARAERDFTELYEMLTVHLNIPVEVVRRAFWLIAEDITIPLYHKDDVIFRILTDPDIQKQLAPDGYWVMAPTRMPALEILQESGKHYLGDMAFIDDEPLTVVPVTEKFAQDYVKQFGNIQPFTWSGYGYLFHSTCSALSSAKFIICQRFKPSGVTLSGTYNPGVLLGPGVTLQDYVGGPLRLQKDSIVVVEGENTIKCREFEACITTSNTLTFTGKGTLSLTCAELASCIGLGAQSQSMGRYIPQEDKGSLKTIVVNGCLLKCNSPTPNFSVGSYGAQNEVEVRCLNGGRVEGMPEALGKIKLISAGTHYSGSTKLTGTAVYEPDDEFEPTNLF